MNPPNLGDANHKVRIYDRKEDFAQKDRIIWYTSESNAKDNVGAGVTANDPY